MVIGSRSDVGHTDIRGLGRKLEQQQKIAAILAFVHPFGNENDVAAFVHSDVGVGSFSDPTMLLLSP
jgi:hypothetical protein